MACRSVSGITPSGGETIEPLGEQCRLAEPGGSGDENESDAGFEGDVQPLSEAEPGDEPGTRARHVHLGAQDRHSASVRGCCSRGLSRRSARTLHPRTQEWLPIMGTFGSHGAAVGTGTTDSSRLVTDSCTV